jgi:Fe(3+) dicitrate transport protein
MDRWIRNTKRGNEPTSGTPGTDANSIIKAEAIAAHILYNLTVDKFTFTPGIRYASS